MASVQVGIGFHRPLRNPFRTTRSASICGQIEFATASSPGVRPGSIAGGTAEADPSL